MFLELLTFLILVVLPLFDIYTCEEPTFGKLDDYLRSVLKSGGFVRQRQCLNLFYFDVIRRYAIFTVPRVVFKIWWWYYRKRGFSWWSGSGSRTEVVARPEI
uniref:Uncharacterized protein LOC111109293 n=1 Tax=Crassostrea virginica TaxID=6565 RepID=A0A8B8BDL1_CRAVI|nr:uncharacterized protein LOC111109293 [Crassostrea virginica]